MIWINTSYSDRSYFSLIFTLLRSGRQILINDSPGALLDSGTYDRRAFQLPGVSLHWKAGSIPRNSIRLPSEMCGGSSVVLPITFDYYTRRRSDYEEIFYLPLSAHPEARLLGLDEVETEASKGPRQKRGAIKCFLAGNLSYPEYGSDRICQAYSILNRLEFVSVIRETLSGQISTNSNGIRDGSTRHLIVLIDQAVDGLSMPEYFFALERSSFLLCPPGVNHPHCHNIFEGMSRGVIPVLEYADFMRPAMRDGINCISFSGRDGLTKAIKRALQLDENEIAKMRSECLLYFKEFCSQDSVLRRICSRNIRQLCMLNEAASMPEVSSVVVE